MSRYSSICLVGNIDASHVTLVDICLMIVVIMIVSFDRLVIVAFARYANELGKRRANIKKIHASLRKEQNYKKLF